MNIIVFVIFDFISCIIIIGGMGYYGQIKKVIFLVQNFCLFLVGILIMYVGVSEGIIGFFVIYVGFLGMGKTMFSNIGYLVVDDQICIEIDVGEDVISNMEGGQYVKIDKFKCEKELEIWDVIGYGIIVENFFVLEDGIVDYDNSSIIVNG